MQNINLLKCTCGYLLLLAPVNAQVTSPIVQTIKHNEMSFRVAPIPLEYYDITLIAEPNARKVVRTHKPVLLMNAGMFHPNHAPVGLEIIDGDIQHPVNTDDGMGNFFLKPNGIFAIQELGAVIEDSDSFNISEDWIIATQSGPLLLHNGEYHPKIQPNSTNFHIRNGVCISENTVYFIISEEPVRFYDLASMMKETLQCEDGLYLDGVVSKLYYQDGTNWTPEISRKPLGNWLVVQVKP